MDENSKAKITHWTLYWTRNFTSININTLCCLKAINEMIKRGQISEYEIWYVNDGSTDQTEQKVVALHENDSNVHLISQNSFWKKSSEH